MTKNGTEVQIYASITLAPFVFLFLADVGVAHISAKGVKPLPYLSENYRYQEEKRARH
jgi:hypothetical protein